MRQWGGLMSCIALALVGCAEKNGGGPGDAENTTTPSTEVEVKEVSMGKQMYRSDNPLEWPDIEIHRPKKLKNTRYDRNTDTIVDLDTGDALKISRTPGPGDRPRQFGFYNPKTGPYAGGSFIEWSGSEVVVRGVSVIYTGSGADDRARAREEYDIGRLAEMLRAYFNEDVQVIIVDGRPEKASEINPQNGIRKDAQ